MNFNNLMQKAFFNNIVSIFLYEAKMLPDLGFSRFIFIISNGIEVDEAVPMIYIAMANEPVLPTDNSPHTRKMFFDKKVNQYKRISMNKTSQINV